MKSQNKKRNHKAESLFEAHADKQASSASRSRNLGILYLLVAAFGVICLISQAGASGNPPVATADSYSVGEDNTLNVAASGVLGNDTDDESDPLTAIKVSDPANGVLTLNANGSFGYTPNGNFNGSDSFTYKANDGTSDSNVATVTIAVNSVNDAPVAAADGPYPTDEDTELTISPAGGVLGNDWDTESDPLQAYVFADPASGIVILNTDGSFTYTPNSNFSGSDTFSYRAWDGAAYSAPALVTINVNAVNDPPIAIDNSYSTNEDTLLNVLVATGVLANDLDVDSPTLSASLVNLPAHGILVFNADGSFTYTPTLNYNGPDSFTYRANDGTYDSNDATVTITVTSVIDLPTISDILPQTIDEDANTGDISFTVGDIETPAASLTLLRASSNTTLVPVSNIVFGGSGANRTVRVTPAANQYGTATITVTVTDSNGGQASDTFLLTVNPVNDAPVASFNASTTSGTGPLSVTFTNTSSDVDNATATLTWNWNFGDGTGTSTAQNPTYVFNTTGAFTVTLTATDPGGLSHSATGTITVRAGISINDITVAENVGNANFTVTLSMPATAAVTVNYATANGTATAGSDYTSTSGTLSIAAGSTTGTITVPILNDTRIEVAETFFVNLSIQSANATITDTQGRATISVDEKANIATINDVTVVENAGNAVFTVSLSAAADFNITVNYTTANDTATAGSDYTTTSGTLTIAAGSTSGTITVPILNDVVLEGSERFFVNLSNAQPSAALLALADTQGIGTINDNDFRLTIVKAGTASDGNCNITASVGSVPGAGGGSGLNFTADYDSSDTVTLTATGTYPAAGSVF